MMMVMANVMVIVIVFLIMLVFVRFQLVLLFRLLMMTFTMSIHSCLNRLLRSSCKNALKLGGSLVILLSQVTSLF